MDAMMQGTATVQRVRIALAVVTLALAALVLAEAMAPTTATISGVVYADRDGDGRLGAGEPGLEGVTVTDGVERVTTDATGRYEIEIDVVRRITDLVYITQPAGYS